MNAFALRAFICHAAFAAAKVISKYANTTAVAHATSSMPGFDDLNLSSLNPQRRVTLEGSQLPSNFWAVIIAPSLLALAGVNFGLLTGADTSRAGMIASDSIWMLALSDIFLFLLILTLLLLAVGIGVAVEREQASIYIAQGWQGANNGVRVTFQNQYQCCGLNTFNDTLAGSPCPCPNQIVTVNGTSCGFTTPCLSALVTAFNNAYTGLAGAGIAFAILMLLGMIFVCYLMTGIRAKNVAKDDTLPKPEDSSNPTTV